jgi:hypothetical protein
MHVHGSHATIVHLVKLDAQRLTDYCSSRTWRPADVHGRLVHGVIA